MNRQDLIDIAGEAMSDAQDYNTTTTDLARAAVAALLPFMKTVDEPIKFACECGAIALQHKGYEGGSVSFFANYTGTGRPWIASYYMGKRGGHKSSSLHAETFSDAVAALSAAIENLPPIWSDEQIAATLGIAA